MVVDTKKTIQDIEKKTWEKRINDWANNFRAGDYVPNSGALKIIASNAKPKKARNQWGW
jgi:hypothetical protein